MTNDQTAMQADDLPVTDTELLSEEDTRYRRRPVRIVNQMADEYLELLRKTDLYEENLNALETLVKELLEQTETPGDADDWHNLSVSLARQSLFHLACDVLEGGLRYFPRNIDLLADYLKYGICCNRIEQCKSIYRTLTKIPFKRWSWRGFSFTIDYLTYLWENTDTQKELDRLENEMMRIAEAFRAQESDTEESYRCEAEIRKLLHETDKEEAVLREALAKLNIAPKCALRLADMLFEHGEYAEALQYIQRGLQDAIQAQRSVNEGYLHFLSGLAKLAMLQKDNAPITAEAANDIYSDFEIAMEQEPHSAFIGTIKVKTIAIVKKSGEPVPEEYEELCALMA